MAIRYKPPLLAHVIISTVVSAMIRSYIGQYREQGAGKQANLVGVGGGWLVECRQPSIELVTEN